jgi:hypothetical protein
VSEETRFYTEYVLVFITLAAESASASQVFHT